MHGGALLRLDPHQNREGIDMHIKEKYSWIKHLDFILIDMITLFCSFLISYLYIFGDIDFAHSSGWSTIIILMELLNVIITLLLNPYSGILRRPYYTQFLTSLKLVLYNMVTISLLLYTMKVGPVFSRGVILGTFLIYYLVSLALKYIWKRALLQGKISFSTTKTKSLFVVCTSKKIREVIKNASAGDFKLYDIKGVFLTDGEDENADVDGIPVIKGDYCEYIIKNNIDEVLFSVLPSEIRPEIYKRLIDNDVGIHLNIEPITGFQVEDQFISHIGVYNTLMVGTYSFTSRQIVFLFIKRIFDALVSLLGIILLVPITATIKLAMLLHGDKAPIFYRQKRIGQYGKEINIVKFRSMVPNADELLQDMLKDEKYRREWDENQKFEKDPRITSVGRFLRKTSIDELQ